MSSFQVKLDEQVVELNFKPYNFQLKLAEKGFKRLNNIVCVRTGSGKTLIAALICKYWENKLNRNKKKRYRVAFIVPTRYLAEQQAEAFKTSFKDDQLRAIVENDTPYKIRTYLQTHNIIFITAQKLINALENEESELNISDFEILIFDECHHTHDNHPYNLLMRFYFKEKFRSHANANCNLPLIIGLTASLGGAFDVENHVAELCSSLDCRELSYLISDEDKQDLKEHIHSPLDDQIESVAFNTELSPVVNRIKQMIPEIAANSGFSKYTNLGIKLGAQAFENDLIDFRNNAEANFKMEMLVGIKYLLELNSFYLNLHDFDLSFCLSRLFEFYKSVDKIEAPLEIEMYCHEKIGDLVQFIKDNYKKEPVNKKLESLVSLIKKYHKRNSKGIY